MRIWTFTAGALTSVPASGNTFIQTNGLAIPFAGISHVTIKHAFTSFAPADSGRMTLVAGAVFIAVIDVTGAVITLTPMPLGGNYFGAIMPTTSEIRVASMQTATVYAGDLIEKFTNQIASATIVAEATIRNTDGVSAHSIQVNVGCLFEYS